LLDELSSLVGDSTFEAVVAAVQRARRIVPAGTLAGYEPAALVEPAEVALHKAVSQVPLRFTSLTHFTEAASPIVEPIATFFEDVFVMAEEPELRAARLGLLATVRDLGADLLDWPQLRL
jgi:glycyl-tRNA synthetase